VLREHREELRPDISTEALRFYRCDNDGHIEHSGGFRQRDGMVDDRLAIGISGAEEHLWLVIDECHDAIVGSQ
jgi:hypothetical protein